MSPASFGKTVRLGHVTGEPQHHRMAANLTVVVHLAGLFLHRRHHHFENFVATRALNFDGFHGSEIT